MVYSIANEELSLSVESFGCQMYSIKSREGLEYLWQGDPSFWADRALTLFPFCASLYDNKYIIDQTQYQMNAHGLAPYYDFNVVDHQQDSITFELCYNEDTLKKYPRKFVFTICYHLDKNRVNIKYEVHNLDEKIMYFGIGGHPGFNVPLNSQLTFEDYYVNFEEGNKVELVGFCSPCYRDDTYYNYPLRDHQYLDLEHRLFDISPLVFRNTAHKVVLKSNKDSHQVTVGYPQMDYVGVWHWPQKDAPYICIEPWTSIPAREGIIEVFEDKQDLLSLEPNKSYINNWYIEIK